MIGTTRRFNEDSKTVDWYRVASQGQKEPPADAKESIIYRVHPEREAGRLIFQIGTADPAARSHSAPAAAWGQRFCGHQISYAPFSRLW